MDYFREELDLENLKIEAINYLIIPFLLLLIVVRPKLSVIKPFPGFSLIKGKTQNKTVVFIEP